MVLVDPHSPSPPVRILTFYVPEVNVHAIFLTTRVMKWDSLLMVQMVHGSRLSSRASVVASKWNRRGTLSSKLLGTSISRLGVEC